MIQAVIFDLDGTLVQTERLKAISYAQAAVDLRPDAVRREDVIAAFKSVVGLPRRDVAQRLLQQFDLQEAARQRMDELGVSSPWQAYVQLRLRIYEQMLADADILRRNQWPHNVELLEAAREAGLRVGLATMSHCAQTRKVLAALGLEDAFDFVATRDDIHHGKPDPEIYLLVADELNVAPEACLVVEDSPAGVEAATRAGMRVVAVSTPFTREHLHALPWLPSQHIVDDSHQLTAVVRHLIRAEAHHQHPPTSA